MKARALLISFCLFSFIVRGQNKVADSLRGLLKTAKEDTNKVIWTVKLGNALFSDADYPELIDIFGEAKALAAKLSYKKGFANACNNMGILYLNQGLYARSLESHLAALKVREEANDLKGMATSYQNLGIVELALKNEDKAFAYYSKALALKEKDGDRKGVAGALQGIGYVFQRSKKPLKALEYYHRSRKIKEEMKDTGAVASVFTNIASVYMDMDSVKSAERYYTEALRLYKKLNLRSYFATAYTNMAKVYNKLGRYGEALPYANSAMELIVKKGSSLDGLKNIEKILSSIYEGLNKYSEALAHYKKFIQYRDSMYNEENTKKTTQTEMNFEFDKKEAQARAEQEKKDAVAAAEVRRQKIVLWAISGFGLLVLGFAVFAWRSFRQKKKANVEITLQKHIIEEKQKEILDSIYYARRIQQSLMPNEKFIRRKLDELQGRKN